MYSPNNPFHSEQQSVEVVISPIQHHQSSSLYVKPWTYEQLPTTLLRYYRASCSFFHFFPLQTLSFEGVIENLRLSSYEAAIISSRRPQNYLPHTKSGMPYVSFDVTHRFCPPFLISCFFSLTDPQFWGCQRGSSTYPAMFQGYLLQTKSIIIIPVLIPECP